MKVLLSAYACIPDAGSEPGYGWNWAIHLAELGIEVTVLTRSLGQEPIEAYLRDHPIANVKFAYVSVPNKRIKPGTGIHYALWQWIAVGVAKKLHREQPFDVVHHVTYTSVHVPTQLWRLGVPTVFGPVGGGQTAPPDMLPYFGSSIKSEKRRTLLTRLLRHSPFHRRWFGKINTIYASNSDTVSLVSALGRPDVILEFDVGVPERYLAPSPRSFKAGTDPVRLIWVGRMLPRKALPLALDALAQVTQPFKFTIVGAGIAEDKVRQMIADRGLTDKVFWSGRRLTVAEVRDAYLEHDAMLFTSIRETAGVQLLEAMAVGLPILTLDMHGAHDLVPETAGFKVPVTSPDETVRNLAAAIDRFASSSAEEKTAMSSASWNFAQNNTWSCHAATAVAKYKELLRN